MPINLKTPQLKELKPRIVVCGVGGAGRNAINNMIVSGLSGVDFVAANTDAQALASSRAQQIIQMGLQARDWQAAAEETLEEIRDCLAGSNMVSSPPARAAPRALPPSSPQPLARWVFLTVGRRHQAVPLRERSPHEGR